LLLGFDRLCSCSAVSLEEDVLKMKFLLAAAVVAACSATPLLAQTQPAAPAQPPSTAPAAPPSPPQTPGVVQPPLPLAAPQSPAGAPVSASPQIPPAMPAAQAPTLSPPVSDSERGTAVLLLERIQQVLDKAVAGKSDEEVTLDRGLLDEIRAEVAQVKQTLARSKQ
jgi:hypothetical protein